MVSAHEETAPGGFDVDRDCRLDPFLGSSLASRDLAYSRVLSGLREALSSNKASTGLNRAVQRLPPSCFEVLTVIKPVPICLRVVPPPTGSAQQRRAVCDLRRVRILLDAGWTSRRNCRVRGEVSENADLDTDSRHGTRERAAAHDLDLGLSLHLVRRRQVRRLQNVS